MNISFIKLDVNIMNDTKVKLIRKMPDGDSILVLWIGLLCLGMKSGRPGVVEIGDGIPFTPDTLSTELDIPINTVKLGLEAFVRFRMIEVWEGGETYLTNFEKHQELERIESAKERSRESSRKHREKVKLLSRDSHVISPPGSRDHTDKNRIDKEEENNTSPPAKDAVDGEGDFYLTKKKRKLKGKRLETFELFWDVFNYKQGKAEAADAWLDIPQLTDALVAKILKAARLEAQNRPKMIANGRTPKMAQGWLSARRWEDEIQPGATGQGGTNQNPDSLNLPDDYYQTTYGG